MAANVGEAPSRAWALGELAALLSRSPADPSADPRFLLDRQRIAELAGHLQQSVAQRQQALTQRSEAARALSAHNHECAVIYPTLHKLQAQMEAFRQAQMAAIDDTEQRRARRRRAEVGVEVAELQRRLQSELDQAEKQRQRVVAAERMLEKSEAEGHARRAALVQAQQACPPLSAYLAPIEHRLLVASCRAYLDGDVWAWAQSRRDGTDQLVALAAQMEAGAFGESEVERYAGGRALVVGELAWGCLAMGGEPQRLAPLQEAMRPGPFSHQIFHVFRAYVPFLLAQRDEAALITACAPHRYAQGLRGALANCVWGYVHNDPFLYGEALKTIPTYDWRQGYGDGYEAFGLISAIAAGMAYLGWARGWPVPAAAASAKALQALWG